MIDLQTAAAQAAWLALQDRRALEAEMRAALRAGVTIADLERIAKRHPTARRFQTALEAVRDVSAHVKPHGETT